MSSPFLKISFRPHSDSLCSHFLTFPFTSIKIKTKMCIVASITYAWGEISYNFFYCTLIWILRLWLYAQPQLKWNDTKNSTRNCLSLDTVYIFHDSNYMSSLWVPALPYFGITQINRHNYLTAIAFDLWLVNQLYYFIFSFVWLKSFLVYLYHSFWSKFSSFFV